MIDQRLLKFRILNECSKWANIFKEYLFQSVIERMNASEFNRNWLNKILITILFFFQEYDSFINCSNKILSQPIESENFNVLLNIMTVINDIKKRDKNAEQLFDGLKKDLFTLLQYDVHVSKKILCQVYNTYSHAHLDKTIFKNFLLLFLLVFRFTRKMDCTS